MSVTVLIQSSKGLTRWQPGKAWFAVPVLLASLSGSVIYYILDHYFEQQQLKQQAEQVRQAQQQHLLQLKDATEQQLATLAAHLAQMQAEMQRLQALGQQVAQTYELEQDFDFNAKAGVGGLGHDSQKITLDELMQQMDQMLLQIDQNQMTLPLLETLGANLHIDKERAIAGRPITKGWLSSKYGMRNDPFTGRRTMHKGIDFAGSEGADVVATASGVVTWAGDMSGYGLMVEIDHGDGLKTRYGHNKSNHVKIGDLVEKGQMIAKMGSTGRSTGPHVHYEVLRHDRQIDPTQFVYLKAQ